MSVEIDNVITDGATVITGRAITVIGILSAPVVVMLIVVLESETGRSTPLAATVRSTEPSGGAEVEGEAAAAIVETWSVDGVACGSAREESGPRRDDAALLSVMRLTRHRPS